MTSIIGICAAVPEPTDYPLQGKYSKPVGRFVHHTGQRYFVSGIRAVTAKFVLCHGAWGDGAGLVAGPEAGGVAETAGPPAVGGGEDAAPAGCAEPGGAIVPT